jgi:hypothetical protein
VSYASFTNSPVSTKLPAHSVAGGRAIPGGVGKSRLAALLALAGSTEFLLVAVAAYSAAVLYHRLILLDSPDAADNWSLLLDLKIIVMTFLSRKVYWNAF